MDWGSTNTYGCYLSTCGGLAVELLVSICTLSVCTLVCAFVTEIFNIYATSYILFQFRVVVFLDAPLLSLPRYWRLSYSISMSVCVCVHVSICLCAA